MERQMKGGEVDRQMKGGEADRQMKGGEVERQMKGGEVDRQMKGGEADRQMKGGEADGRMHCKKNLQNSCTFFTKPFRNGKNPMLTRDFFVPSREGIFCLLRREKYSSFCRGNFFLSVECYISLIPLFP